LVLRAGVAEVHQPAEAGMVISIDRVSVPPSATRTKSSVLALMGLVSGGERDGLGRSVVRPGVRTVVVWKLTAAERAEITAGLDKPSTG